ncbi:facilitated trehalose transporter Tret1-like isoform X2 [Anthonomus grandis grandis]|uniref:facilitated trehalose transporter Tret1-like isoform X2 n=1 Tax=Anthonomus grandis grandis TaxID=2921223 RepID=UPI0021650B8C|nr:facilitated trehalose transporter Tret1-like isoform X2 [Anthonomus grandis grandis]
MDPIGIEENARANLDENDRKNEQLAEIICSVRSLSKYEGRSFRTLCPQIAAAAIAASYHIVVGIALAYSAILIPSISNETSTDGEIYATKTESSWIASTIVIVTPIGGITGGFIMDSYGRLNTLKLAVIPSVIGWIVIAMAQNVPMLIIGRMLTGIATSWGSSPAIVYITEIARVDMRGSLISFGPAYASLGMVLAFLKGWFLHWRTVAWMSLGYSVIPLILISFIIPESPAWLVSKGRVEEASKSLKWIHRNQPQPEHRTESLAELQLQLLQKEHQLKLEEESKKGNGFWTKAKLFLRPTGYKPLIILFGLFVFQQFSGIYITLFYSVTFLKETGSTVNPYLASILIGTVRCIMSCVNTYMLRTFHRRPLIMLSGVGMACCMLLSGFFTMWINNGTSTQKWVPTCLLLLYVITSMIGLLPIPWTMTAELFPIEIRGIAHSIAYSIANIVMFVSIQTFYSLEDLVGGIVGVQWFFAVVALMGSLYTFIFLPETHGKKLSEITNYFVNSSAIYLLSRNKNKTSQNKKPASRVPNKNIVKSNKQSEKLINDI